jgi:hypothetical protein
LRKIGDVKLPSLRKRREQAMRKMTPHLKRVGAIASLWSQIELNLDIIIWTLLKTEQQLAACVTAQIGSASAKLRSIKALLALIDITGKHDAIKKSLNKFGNDIEAIQIKRNRAVHDTWQVSLTTKRVFQMRAAIKDNKLLFAQMKITVRELDKTLAQIRALLKRVYVLEQQIVAAFAPSPHKQAPRQFSQIQTTRTPTPRKARRTRLSRP